MSDTIEAGAQAPAAIANDLRDSEAKYRALAENIPQRVFIKDLQSRYLAVNQNYAGDLGAAPQDIVGHDDYAFHPRALADKYRADDRRVMETGQREECDESYSRGGREYTIHTVRTPVRNESGQVIGVCGIFWDVTEQLQAREMLHRSETSLNEAQRLSQIGSWELDLVNNRLSWSDEIFRIFEIDPRHFSASYEAFVAAIHPEDRDRVDRAYRDSLDNRTAYQIDHRLLMPDGRVKHVRERGETHYQADRPLRSIGTVQDITEHIQHEELLAKHNRMLTGLAAIKAMLMRETDERQVAHKMCCLLVEQSQFRMAWIGMVADDGIHVEPIAEAGFENGYLARADIRCDDSPQGAGPTGTAIRLGATMSVDDIETDPRFAPWRESARTHRYRSSAAAPIRLNDKVIGAINIYASTPGAIGPHEVVLLEKLADDLGHIKERFAAERALRESEAQSRLLLDSAAEGIYGVDTEGLCTFVNAAALRMLGYRREDDLIGKNIHALIHHSRPDGSPYSKEMCHVRLTVLEGKSAHCDDEVHWRADGTSFPVEYWSHPMHRDGQLAGAVVTFVDITERRWSEEALRSFNRDLENRVSEQTRELRMAKEEAERESHRNATIVHAAMDGFFTASLDGRLKDCNEAYCRMLGYSREEMLRLRIPDIEADVTPETMAAHISKIVEQGHDRYDTRHRRKDGGRIHAEVNVTLARIGEETLFFAFVHNITDRKANEAALILSRDEAERANRAKSVFLTRMSHELRTPLNAILGFGQLLERDPGHPLSASQRDSVGEILHAGRHLLEMINEMLDLARIEAGRLSVSLVPVDVGPLLRECLALMAPLAEARGIRVTEEASSVTGGVLADGTRLKQVLINLLSNAVKYNRDRGRVIVACDRIGDRIRIAITDTGPGLTPDQRAMLFRPFERLDADRNAIEGTGIGLALSKRLTELMGGEIGLESTPGEGSTFWVRFPATEPACDGQETVDAPEAAPRLGLRTILYIEGNPVNLRLMERILSKRTDIRLISAERSGIGLELAAVHRPDLILLDINLPDMDGYQVLSRLRDTPDTHDLPVIGISANANAMPRDMERAREAGFADYLTKPLDIGQLLRAIDHGLGEAPNGRKEVRT